ncbi:hypothetical protein AUP68_06918 [Ilyonectria robusta]
MLAEIALLPSLMPMPIPRYPSVFEPRDPDPPPTPPGGPRVPPPQPNPPPSPPHTFSLHRHRHHIGHLDGSAWPLSADPHRPPPCVPSLELPGPARALFLPPGPSPRLRP